MEQPVERTGIDAGSVDVLDARFTVASFLVVLVAWATFSLVHDPGSVAASENRYRAVFPDYDATRSGMPGFIAGIDDWLTDRVGFRDALIKIYARVEVGWLGVSPSSKLIVGRSGWFYFNDPVAVAQYQGVASFDHAQLETWRRVLEDRRDWLAQRGIPFIVVLVPNKHQIYPEYMPEALRRISEDEQHGQLARHLAAHSDLSVVDLMPVLLAAKKRERVYHRTDTHWNDFGAYLGYRAILEAVGKALPEYATALQPVSVTVDRFEARGIGLTSMVGLSDIYREEILQLRKVEPRSEILMEKKQQYARFEREQRPLAHGVPGARLPRAVVFRDSFANALIPYLSENFRRVLYVWTRDVVPRYVERERPDVVIQEIAGRLLDRMPVAIDVVAAEPRRPSERTTMPSAEK